MSAIRLSALTVYPIKGAAGIAVPEWDVDAFGLRFDRRWMLVDESGRFLSQRTCRRLALLRPAIHANALAVSAPAGPTLELPLVPRSGERVRVTVWNSVATGLAVDAAADAWFTEVLGVSCRPVFMPDDVVRPVAPAYAVAGDRTSFTDGFPFLLTAEPSLDDLNRRLADPVPMNRFRPNLVVTGGDPFAEDRWAAVRIGPIHFRVAKPCARCVVTTIDQATGVAGPEPLRALATFRRHGDEILFGWNLIHTGTGRLTVGAPVEVTRRG